MMPAQAHPPQNESNRAVVWTMIAMIVLSFAFGVAMFIPEEHRAQKWQEAVAKQQAREQRL